MKSRKSPLPYLILNVVVSACTTLLVLLIWSLFQRAASPVQFAGSLADSTPTTAILQPTIPACPEALAQLPPLDQAVIEVLNVFGSGDLQNEVVELRRVGDGDLCLNGWKMRDEQGNEFTFPNLVLNKDGGVSINTRAGRGDLDTFFWGMETPVWQIGETVTILDTQDNIRATFIIQ
jgi:hypothetical protein